MFVKSREFQADMEGKRERVKAKVIASFINMLRPRVGEEEEKERERERERSTVLCLILS